MRLKPTTWMLISLMLFIASAWMWHVGKRVQGERQSAANQPAAAASAGSHTVAATPSAASPKATLAKAAAKTPASYVLRNTTQTLKQLERNDRAVILRNALIDTTSRTKLDIPAHLRSDTAPGAYIVQSPRVPNAGFYAELSKDGAMYVSYIPNDAVLVQASPDVAKILETDPVFAAVLPYEPYYKLDASLLPEAVDQTLMTNNSLRVTVYPGQTDAAVQALNALGAHVFGEDPGPFGTTLVALVPPDKLVAVAQMPQAQEIESYSHRILANDLVRMRLGVAPTQTTPVNYLGLTGTNIWIALNDTGVDQTHPDLMNRLAFNAPDLQILSTDTNGHGTHVAGIIAGDGTASTTVTSNIPGSGVPVANQFRGMAPQAELAVTAVDTITGPFYSDSYLQTVPDAYLTGITAGNTAGVTNGFVANNSWFYASTTYDISAASYDAATRDSQPNVPGEQAMLYVFAAGDNFQVPGSINSPATAKNVITVGAIQSPRNITNLITVPGETNVPFWQGDTDGSNQVAALTAAGNVDVGTEGPGGRFKPDVVAPGIFVISARSANYVDPSELQTVILNEWPGPTTGPAITPGQTNIYAITIPSNTATLVIQARANPQSPVPFPTDLQFYFNTTNIFPAGTQILTTDEAGLPLVNNPTPTNCYIGVYEPAGDAQPVAYDLFAWITTNGPFGTYFSTLSNLNSALAPNYRYESGTSMSAAAVSGMLADMQEFLTSNLNVMPSPALLKALLINGARPLNGSSDLNPAPLSNLEGWGLPNLSNSVPATLTSNLDSSMVLFDQVQTNGVPNALQTGQWHNYMITLGTNATNFPLRCTLVWTDPPGNPAAGIALVNNLDLMVADNTGTNLFIGNDFPLGGGEAGVFTQPSPTNTADPSDLVNNVENVYLDSVVGLQQTYYLSVRGTRVGVNAVSGQTNGIMQDYALVISTDDQTANSGLTVTDLGITNAPLANFAIVSSWTNTNAIPLQSVSVISSGLPLLHQRVGGNEPNLWTPVFGGTNGNPLQWHFFVMTNTVTATNTNDNLAIFSTFLPPSLTFNQDPDNMSLPANENADIDLYVSTDSSMTNLNATAVADSYKSLGRGGNETVFITNVSSNEVFYAGVKSETQQGADFGFFAEITSNGPPANGNNPVTGYGNVPVPIPDEAPGGQGAFVFAPMESTMTVRKVVVEVGLEHPNPADLYGTIMSPGDSQATLNNYTASEWAGFTNIYDDLPDGTVTNAIGTDYPGTLKTFVGQQATGMWILNETDNALLQTGLVTTLQVTAYPQPQNPLDFFATIPPFGWYYGYVDVPDDTTNLSIAVGFSAGGPVGIYITNQDDVAPIDYGVIPIPPPGGQLDVPTIASNIPVGATVNPPSPPIAGGRWFYGIFNDSSATLTVHVVITISESQTPNLSLTEANNTPTSLLTDAHTQSQICVDGGIFTNNQSLVSLQVGVRLEDTNLDDLVLHLISPQGTSVELFEDRGGTSANGLGVTVTNAGSTNGTYDYTTFSENTNLATSLIKFAIPPYAQPTTNTALFVSSFETVGNGDYGQTNALLQTTLGTNLEIWTVTSNDVSVVDNSNILFKAYDGTNYLALADGQLTAAIPTVVGQEVLMTYAYRGPGLVDWWPFEGDAEDIIGTNNGITSNVQIVPGEVGQAFQFNGNNSQIDFGPTAGNVGTNDFTIDYWMNTSNSPSSGIESFLNNRSPGCGEGVFLDITVGHGNPPSPGLMQIVLRNNGAGDSALTGVNKYNDGQWHHVAWVRRANSGAATCSLLLYVDGQLNAVANGSPITAINTATHLVMGQDPCTTDAADGRVPYGGAADELDIWHRALTDVEIAAIYEAGADHLSKATPTSILPNCQFLVNGVTNSTIISPANGTNWLTNIVYFTAFSNTTSVVLRGNPLGMLFDDFMVIGPTNFNYLLPEQSLSSFTGENPDGCWTLDVWDTRNDSPLPTNGVLLSWNLQMTVSATNVNLIVLTNHIPYTNGLVQSNTIEYFAFDVPITANFATNTLTNASTNLTLFFNQTALPTGNQLGDYALISNTNYGVYVLTNNAPPPDLVPGRRYFLGVLNASSASATFTLQVDTDSNNLVVTPLTNGIALTTNILVSTNAVAFTTDLYATNAPQYYSFEIPTNAILASFEIINPTNQIDLYVRHTAPLPSSTSYDYATSYNGTNDEAIVITTNSVGLSGTEESTNSTPVPLTPGTWYAAVYDYSPTNTTNAVTYTILATYITNSVVAGVTNDAITIIPLTNQVAGGSYATNGTSAAGPALTNFYSFTVTNEAPGVQFVVTNMNENVDLIVRDGFLPTPQQLTAGSYNPGTNAEIITIVTNDSMPSLQGVWYLGVPDNGPTNIIAAYTISAVTLTNITNIYTSPAVVFSSAVITAPTNGFTMTWDSVAGAGYEVDMTTNFSAWTFEASVTTAGTTGTYTDPTPINSQAARFYRVFRTH